MPRSNTRKYKKNKGSKTMRGGELLQVKKRNYKELVNFEKKKCTIGKPD